MFSMDRQTLAKNFITGKKNELCSTIRKTKKKLFLKEKDPLEIVH
jgi:hypothetical protein